MVMPSLEASDKWSPHPRVCNLGPPVVFNIFIDDTEEGTRCVLLSGLQMTSEREMPLTWQSVCSEKARDHCAWFIQRCATEGQMWHEKFSHGKRRNIHRSSKRGLPGSSTSHGSRLSPPNSTQSQTNNSLFQAPIKKAWREEKLFGAWVSQTAKNQKCD